MFPKHVFDGSGTDAKNGKVVGSEPDKGHEQAPLSNTSSRSSMPTKVAAGHLQDDAVESIRRRRAAGADISGASPEAQIVENIPAARTPPAAKSRARRAFADGGNNLLLLFKNGHHTFDDKIVARPPPPCTTPSTGRSMIEVVPQGARPRSDASSNQTVSSLPPGHDFTYDPTGEGAGCGSGVSKMKVILLTTNTRLVTGCVTVIKEGWDAIGVSPQHDEQDTRRCSPSLDGGADFQVVATIEQPDAVPETTRIC